MQSKSALKLKSLTLKKTMPNVFTIVNDREKKLCRSTMVIQSHTRFIQDQNCA